MFKQFNDIIKSASAAEITITSEYTELKQNKAIQIKKELISETEKINNDQALMDYNPMNIHNKITSLNIEHQQIKSNEIQALEKLKKNTEEELNNIMEYHKGMPITEIFKDIYSCLNNSTRWVCRVWFSLVENKKINIKPGDPFKIKWFDINQNTGKYINNFKYNNSSERKTKNENELLIPQFSNPHMVTSDNNLYKIDHWGANSSQYRWWVEWVKQNRPF